jgi:hypothetical protein
MITFSASLTNLTTLLPQSHERNCYIADQYWHLHRPDCTNTLIYAHTNSRNLSTSDTSLDSLLLPAPEAGDILELILLYSDLLALHL